MKILIYVFILLTFIACGESNSNTTTEPVTTPTTEPTTSTTTVTEPSAKSEIITIAIKTKEDLAAAGVYGDYWNRPNISEVEDGDQYISIKESTQKEIWAQLYFEEYVGSINDDDELEVEARISCAANLVLAEENSFELKKEDDFCLDDNNKLYFILEGEQKGISFDGKTIKFYKK